MVEKLEAQLKVYFDRLPKIRHVDPIDLTNRNQQKKKNKRKKKKELDEDDEDFLLDQMIAQNEQIKQ